MKTRPPRLTKAQLKSAHWVRVAEDLSVIQDLAHAVDRSAHEISEEASDLGREAHEERQDLERGLPGGEAWRKAKHRSLVAFMGFAVASDFPLDSIKEIREEMTEVQRARAAEALRVLTQLGEELVNAGTLS